MGTGRGFRLMWRHGAFAGERRTKHDSAIENCKYLGIDMRQNAS